MKKLVCVAVLGLTVLVGRAVTGEDKPKNSISDVMEKAHKGKPTLLQKVITGQATDAEKKQLLALYEDLAKNKPEKNPAKWKAKTDRLVQAAKEVASGKKEAVAALRQASNCKACHDDHRE